MNNAPGPELVSTTAPECLCSATSSIPTMATYSCLTAKGLNLRASKQPRLWPDGVLRDMAGDELPDGDQRSFVARVRDEAGEVVLRAALSLVMEYCPKF